MKIVAPAARATGVSVEKTAALSGVLANNGLKGSVAGTGLSKSFIELNKKGITLEEGMSKVANSSNKLNTAIELVGVVGAKSFLSLAESGEAITDLEQQFIDAGGAAKSMSEIRLDNLEGDVTKLGSAWEGFLLGLEDGEGSLNDLQRTIVKGLTVAVSKLGKVVDVLAFSFNLLFTNSKLLAGGSKDFLVGVFKILGSAITLFTNKAKLELSDIPIIGRAIDKKAVEANIAEAKKGILKGAELLKQSSDKFRESALNTLTAGARFRIQQEGKAERVEMARQAKLKEAKQKEIDEESEEQRLEREKAQKELRKQIKKAEDQELKNKLSLLKMIEDAENDFFNRSLTKQELEVQAVNDKYFNLIEQAKKYGEDTSILEQAQAAELLEIKTKNDALDLEQQNKTTKAGIELSEKEAEAKKQNLEKVWNALGSFAELAGKETAAGKALAISQALISTYQSAQSSYASLAPIPIVGPALGIAAAGAAVAGGLKQIQSIKSVKVPNSGVGGGASVGGAGGVGAAPAPPSFNVVGASNSNQLAEAIGGQSQQPIQDYVVSNDVTTAQSLQNNRVEDATIG